MRSYAILTGACILLTSLTFSQQIQSGDFAAGVNSEGWSLNGGSGSRIHLVFVKFEKPFTDAPQVIVTLTLCDGAPGKDGNVRLSMKPENISRSGFVIKISTWGDSRVTGVEGSWMAFAK